MVFREEFTVQTSGHRDMHEITAEVEAIAVRSGIQDGIVHVFNRNYGHEQAWHDGNGHSHLQATLMGPEISVPLAAGRLILGTWQQIFHLEADIKPRTRRIVVTVMGE